MLSWETFIRCLASLVMTLLVGTYTGLVCAIPFHFLKGQLNAETLLALSFTWLLCLPVFGLAAVCLIERKAAAQDSPEGQA